MLHRPSPRETCACQPVRVSACYENKEEMAAVRSRILSKMFVASYDTWDKSIVRTTQVLRVKS